MKATVKQIKPSKVAAKYMFVQARQFVTKARFLKKHAEFIDSLGIDSVTGYGSCIDFDHLSHSNVIKVIKHFGGKWTKSLCDTKVNYTREAHEGIIIRCYGGEPPPNCRIVSRTVQIPASFIAAHEETRNELVCK
jgi:hypothetical protein